MLIITPSLPATDFQIIFLQIIFPIVHFLHFFNYFYSLVINDNIIFNNDPNHHGNYVMSNSIKWRTPEI